MPRIRVLDDRTANQIAAGEVVERPASVVKELVENALDAGAARITVELHGGGKALVRVIDDGTGMAPEDAVLSLQRHATSKITSADDLRRITTMGFRGEALPSIASVSRFELLTREPGAMAGHSLRVAGGTVEAQGEVGCQVGTRVSVHDLFYNVPARLKFLKSTATELARCTDVVSQIALAHPSVAVRLLADSRQVFATPGTGRVQDAAVAVLGAAAARHLLPVDLADASGRVWGFTGRPEGARAGRSQQYFFVNRRAVRTSGLRYPLEEAYAHLLPQGRYPTAVLFIEVDPELVDVNVHPAKLEVRFQREREIRGILYRAVRQTLEQSILIPGTAGRESAAPPSSGTGSPLQPGTLDACVPPGAAPAARSAAHEAELTYPYGPRGTAWQPVPDSGWSGVLQQRLVAPAAQVQGETAAAALAGGAPTAPAELVNSMRPLGQVHRSYIVCDGPGGLYVVDQHAAHERVFFERLMAEAETGDPAVQPLLFPIALDVSAGQMAVWEEWRDLLIDAGFQVEPFGRAALLIHAVPSVLGDSGAARLVSDFLDRLQDDRLGASPEGPLDRRRRLLSAMAACKAAVKAHDALAVEEVSALLSDLSACRNPATCPHGRPTVILIGSAELARRFGRT